MRLYFEVFTNYQRYLYRLVCVYVGLPSGKGREPRLLGFEVFKVGSKVGDKALTEGNAKPGSWQGRTWPKLLSLRRRKLKEMKL